MFFLWQFMQLTNSIDKKSPDIFYFLLISVISYIYNMLVNVFRVAMKLSKELNTKYTNLCDGDEHYFFSIFSSTVLLK